MDSSHLMLITSLRDRLRRDHRGTGVWRADRVPDQSGIGGGGDDTCGIKVPVKTRSALVAGLAGGIARLDEHEHYGRSRQGGMLRAQDFAWEKEAAVGVDRIYRQKPAEHEATKS